MLGARTYVCTHHHALIKLATCLKMFSLFVCKLLQPPSYCILEQLNTLRGGSEIADIGER